MLEENLDHCMDDDLEIEDGSENKDMADEHEMASEAPAAMLYRYEPAKLPQLLEAILLATNRPLSEKQLLELFDEAYVPSLNEFRQAIYELQTACEQRGIELVECASGFQMQSKAEYAPWISKLWEEKPAKYSRAFMETLALIAYRQPITRGEIEEIRGVSISSSIFKTLQDERGWIRLVGHRDVPGKPGLYATTKQFLDYFGLKSLDQLPSLPEILSRIKEGENLELDLEAALAADEALAEAQANTQFVEDQAENQADEKDPTEENEQDMPMHVESELSETSFEEEQAPEIQSEIDPFNDVLEAVDEDICDASIAEPMDEEVIGESVEEERF